MQSSPTPTPTKSEPPSKTGTVAAVVIGFMLFCWACSAMSPSGGTGSEKLENGGTALYNADDKTACVHAHNVLVDVKEGLLTVEELRGKVQEVRRSANTPAVEAAANKMLAALTTNSGVATATTGLISACKLL